MRNFLGIDLSRESVPVATTLLKFRRRLPNDLTRASSFWATEVQLMSARAEIATK